MTDKKRADGNKWLRCQVYVRYRKGWTRAVIRGSSVVVIYVGKYIHTHTYKRVQREDVVQHPSCVVTQCRLWSSLISWFVFQKHLASVWRRRRRQRQLKSKSNAQNQSLLVSLLLSYPPQNTTTPQRHNNALPIATTKSSSLPIQSMLCRMTLSA